MNEPADAASVALVRDGRVLLIQRALPPYAGCWTLPGGGCEEGEAAEQTAVRELREELGIVAARLRPLTTMAVGSWRLAVFGTEEFRGEVIVSAEIDAWRWASLEEAGGLATTPGLHAVLELALHGEHPVP